MGVDVEGPIHRIEHDHTHLHVLFEDLKVVSVQALASEDPALLQDARLQWNLFQGEISHHCAAEEQELFPSILARFPDLRGWLERLMDEHTVLRKALMDLGHALDGTFEVVSGRRATFDQVWERLEAIWRSHSGDEWMLLQGVSARLRVALPPGEVGPDTPVTHHPLVPYRV